MMLENNLALYSELKTALTQCGANKDDRIKNRDALIELCRKIPVDISIEDPQECISTRLFLVSVLTVKKNMKRMEADQNRSPVDHDQFMNNGDVRRIGLFSHIKATFEGLDTDLNEWQALAATDALMFYWQEIFDEAVRDSDRKEFTLATA